MSGDYLSNIMLSSKNKIKSNNLREFCNGKEFESALDLLAKDKTAREEE